MKKVIILLTWKRLQKLDQTLKMLYLQTDREFDVHISNANTHSDSIKAIETSASKYSSRGMNVKVTHDGNEHSCFRRFFIAKDYAERGYEIVFFLDDDITVPRFYVEKMMKQFKPGAYHSCYVWAFQNNPQNYWRDRTRVTDDSAKIRYGGAGVSMTDAKIFLDKRLFNVISPMAYQIDDLWMSYYCDHIAKIPIVYTHIPNLVIGGNDSSALYKKLKREDGDQKSLFLNKLMKSGWKL